MSIYQIRGKDRLPIHQMQLLKNLDIRLFQLLQTLLKYKRMQNLLLYLYQKNINSSDPNSKVLCKGQPLRIYNLKPDQLQFYNTMLIRNFFAYSAANMELKLSTKHLVAIYRLHKFQSIIEKAGIIHLFKQWLSNDMMPISVQSNKVPSTCPFVYIDYNQQMKGQQTKPKQVQQPELKRNSSKTKQKQKGKKKVQQVQAVPGKKQQNTKVIAMINLIELTNSLQNIIITRQLGLKQVDFKNQEKRAELIQQFQQIKMEEYVNQRFNTDTLMAFNFIKKYPYIDEKQLLSKTMLSAAQLRKCLAHLIAEGFVNFYPENSRTMLYKSIPNERLKQKYVDHICQAILNLMVYLDKKQEKEQDKLKIMLRTISYLDDILMIFMA